MRTLKISLAIITFLVLLQSAFSLGVYDQDEFFTHHVKEQDFSINVSINSPNQVINVEKGILNINGTTYNTTLDGMLPEELLVGGEKTYSFTPQDFGALEEISSDKEISFELKAYEENGEEIAHRGDPTKFNINVDTTKPILLSPSNDSTVQLSNDNYDTSLTFSERVQSYSVSIDEEVVEEWESDSISVSNFPLTTSITFPEDKINEGTYDIKVDFTDLAGNSNTAYFTIGYRAEPLNVSLVTIKDNSELNYFYSTEYSEFLDEKIHSNTEAFTLTLETNKQAECYFSNSLTEPKRFGEGLEDETKMDSQDGTTHTIQVSTQENNEMWVGCKNPVYSDDTVYLANSLEMENSLIGYTDYNREALSINSTMPEGTVTSHPFLTQVSTNNPAVCHIKVDSQDKTLMENENNFRDHKIPNLETGNGSHSLGYTCFDKVYNEDTISKQISVDPSAGVNINSLSPEYAGSSPVTTTVSLSDSIKGCKYSIGNESESYADYGSLSNISGQGLRGEITINSPQQGNNKVWIYCRKDGELSKDHGSLLYDSQGPRLSNLTFIVGDEPSNYLRNTNEVEFDAEAESIIPIREINASLTLSNSTITKSLQSPHSTISEDISGAQRLEITAIDELGRKSNTLSKNIMFDSQPPSLNLIKNVEGLKLECTDTLSGCSQIRYGLASNPIECSPSNPYTSNSTIERQDFNNICAIAEDKAGNREDITRSINVETEPANITTNQTNSTNTTTETNTTEENTTETSPDPYFNQTSPSDSETKDDNNATGYAIAAGIFLLVAGVSGGGYVAYRKGYLDKQLKKLGVEPYHPKSTQKPQQQSQQNQNTNTQQTTKSAQKPQQQSQSKSSHKSKHDSHMQKLNKFLDESLNKKSSSFDQFEDGPNKGNVEGYGDSLYKGDHKHKKDSSFDEFYTSSKSNPATNAKSVKDEAKDFEDFYKKKKKNDGKK